MANLICPKCGSSSYLPDSIPATLESLREEIQHCLLCGYSVSISRAPRYPDRPLEPLRKRGRPASGRSVLHPESQVALKRKAQGLVP